jgi:putative aminopeptidase FrvX
MKREGIVPARPLVVAFTVHEEGGAHGAKGLAQRERPEIFLAVDGCPVVAGSGVVADGRPATWSMDVKGHYDQRLVRQLIGCGKAVGTEVQVAVFRAGAYSDASAVYDVGAAARVGVVGHARENSHGFEVLRLGVLDNLLALLERFVVSVE